VLRTHEELRHSSERIRDLSRRLLSAQDEERSRIARELDDDLGQRISRLSMDLQLLGDGKQLGHADRRELMRDVQARAGDIARRLHDLSHELHPAKLQVIGLIPALESLCREFSQSGIALDFTYRNVPGRLPANLTICLFRVAQEALLNVARHSDARAGAVHLEGHESSLSFTIADDGEGFEVERAWEKGFGLVSIKERVESIGGTLVITSGAAEGTSMSITVPVPQDEHETDPAAPEWNPGRRLGMPGTTT
jgi:signal transduction histidine kinase